MCNSFRRSACLLSLYFVLLASFNKLSEAAEACASIGSTLATAAQLDSAHALGAEWCFCAAVSNGQWSFPMHKIAPGCGSTMSVFKGCTAGGATCYGRKPRKGSIKGLLPFNGASYHAPGVTPPGPPNYGDNEGRDRCAHARSSEQLEKTSAKKKKKRMKIGASDQRFFLFVSSFVLLQCSTIRLSMSIDTHSKENDCGPRAAAGGSVLNLFFSLFRLVLCCFSVSSA